MTIRSWSRDMAEVAAGGTGWINIVPVVEEDHQPPAPGPFAFLGGSTHQVPTVTWMPGKVLPDGTTRPTTVGVQHAAGTHLAWKLGDLGLTLPDGWRITQDHPRRGLVATVPPGAARARSWTGCCNWPLRSAPSPPPDDGRPRFTPVYPRLGSGGDLATARRVESGNPRVDEPGDHRWYESARTDWTRIRTVNGSARHTVQEFLLHLDADAGGVGPHPMNCPVDPIGSRSGTRPSWGAIHATRHGPPHGGGRHQARHAQDGHGDEG